MVKNRADLFLFLIIHFSLHSFSATARTTFFSRVCDGLLETSQPSARLNPSLLGEDLMRLVPESEQARVRPLLRLISRVREIPSEIIDFTQAVVDGAEKNQKSFTFRQVGYLHGNASLQDQTLILEVDMMHATGSWFPRFSILFDRHPQGTHYYLLQWLNAFLQAGLKRAQRDGQVENVRINCVNPVNPKLADLLANRLKFSRFVHVGYDYYREVLWIDVPVLSKNHPEPLLN